MADIATTPTRERVEQPRAERTRDKVTFTPRVDIVETDRELLLYAELPGVKSEDVNLHYEKAELTLHAKVAPRLPQQGFMLKEYEEGDFYRAFTIHESIDAQKIEAQFKNGILLVHLPKVEAVQPRQISVKVEE